jgi:hypothetical protein
MKMNKNGANKKSNPTLIQQRKRILPTTHIRRQQKESKEDSSSEQDDGAVSSPDSASAIDDNESVPRGKIHFSFQLEEEEEDKGSLNKKNPNFRKYAGE